jgi:hypothetical protein
MYRLSRRTEVLRFTAFSRMSFGSVSLGLSEGQLAEGRTAKKFIVGANKPWDVRWLRLLSHPDHLLAF